MGKNKDRTRIWTLIGSARFEDEFHKWNEILSLSGQVVFSLAVFPSQKETKGWYTPHQKAVLDLVHMYKIANSTHVLILNKGGYIGESTAREAVYALSEDKEVLAIEQVASVLDGRSIPVTSLSNAEPCPLLWQVSVRALSKYMKEQINGETEGTEERKVDWDKVKEGFSEGKERTDLAGSTNSPGNNPSNAPGHAEGPGPVR